MHWKRFGFTCAILSLLALHPGFAQTTAQTEPRVQELSGEELSSETLIQVLQPREEAPPEFRARGSKANPKCELYRRQRGGAGKVVADIAALQILFAYDSADLTPDALRSLDELGKALTSRALTLCCFQIEGHTDSDGSDAYNWSLSERRARSVIEYLSQKFGIDKDRLLSVGLGENKPITSNSTEEGRRRNRRVQVVNLGYGQVEP